MNKIVKIGLKFGNLRLTLMGLSPGGSYGLKNISRRIMWEENYATNI